MIKIPVQFKDSLPGTQVNRLEILPSDIQGSVDVSLKSQMQCLYPGYTSLNIELLQEEKQILDQTDFFTQSMLSVVRLFMHFGFQWSILSFMQYLNL